MSTTQVLHNYVTVSLGMQKHSKKKQELYLWFSTPSHSSCSFDSIPVTIFFSWGERLYRQSQKDAKQDKTALERLTGLLD